MKDENLNRIGINKKLRERKENQLNSLLKLQVNTPNWHTCKERSGNAACCWHAVEF